MLILGDVRTMSSLRRIGAVLIRDGVVDEIGAAEDLLARYPGEARHRFETVTPGLHDAHAHPLYHGQALSRLDLSGCHDPQDAADRVAARSAKTAPGEWIVGGGYLFDEYPPKELLDAAAPRHPVLLNSRDLHSCWVNSLALKVAGVGRQTPDPDEGMIVRGGSGEPAGVLLEAAGGLVRKHLPKATRDDLEAGLRDFARRGYTAVHHMGFCPLDFATSVDSPVRLWWALDADDWRSAHQGWPNPRLHVASVKFFMDGALGSKSAWMHDAYPDGSFGMPLNPAEFVLHEGADAIRQGLSIVAHAIGTRAVTELLDVFHRLPHANAPRPLRIEHAQHVRDADLPKFGGLPLAISMQPIHAVEDVTLVRTHTPGRESEAFRVRDLWKTGRPMAFGSDAPVASPDVRKALEAATSGPFQTVTLDDALWAHTRGAALAAGWDRQGVIEPGAWADFTLWDGGNVVGRVFDGRLETF